MRQAINRMTEKNSFTGGVSDFLADSLRLALLAALVSGVVVSLPAVAADAEGAAGATNVASVTSAMDAPRAQAPVIPVTVTKEMRCPVCGMYPSRYPKWMAQLIFTDRESRAFDSPADLFRFLQNRARYERKHGAADIGAIYLTDYTQGGWIEAQRAFVVAGSNARGPMNNADLPAFGSQAAADAFAKANGGKVLAFDAVTPEVLATLESARHGHEEHAH